MEVLRQFARSEDVNRPGSQYLLHRKHIRPAQVVQCADEGAVVGQTLIPPSILGGECGGDEYLIDRSIVSNPREALGKGSGILRKERREVRVLKVADPIRNPEVAEVGDR